MPIAVRPRAIQIGSGSSLEKRAMNSDPSTKPTDVSPSWSPYSNSVAWSSRSDIGSRSTFHFCPTCGATVYYTGERREDGIAIPIGAFADPSFPAPTVSVYENRMHAWVEVPAGIEHT